MAFALATATFRGVAAHSNDGFAVGPQYDTTRDYVAPSDFDRFVSSVVATFGGTSSPKGSFTVTPTPSKTFSRVRIHSAFGLLVAIVSNGFLSYPYGREVSGYGVRNLDATLTNAVAPGARVLVPPVAMNDRRSAMVEFPGGVIAEIHSVK